MAIWSDVVHRLCIYNWLRRCLFSVQLGVLQKEPLGGSRLSDRNCEAAESKELLAQNQSYSAEETQNMFNINLSGKIWKSSQFNHVKPDMWNTKVWKVHVFQVEKLIQSNKQFTINI